MTNERIPMAASSPIKRHGGKAYLASKIRALFPPHTRYVEPFFGSGAVMFAGDGEGVAEFANDLDKHLANFWNVLRNPGVFDEFRQRVEATPFSKPGFEDAEWPLENGSPIGRAWAFFVRNRQSRQALGKDFATPTSRLRRGMNEQVSAWLSAVDGLPEFHARLRRVEIRCQTACSLIQELDTPETLFYCDPPYVHSTRNAKDAYMHEMSDAEHLAFLGIMSAIKGKFVLSGYPNAMYDDMAARCGWHHVDFAIDNKASGAKSKEKKTERCWMNYQPESV